jgi:microcystin-dependent protein
MSIMATLRRILNDTPGTATNIDYNFAVVEDYINSSVVTTDGQNAMSGTLVLSGPPTDPLHAASKGYVDSLWFTGMSVDYGGDTAPQGWVLENGALYSSTDPVYRPLFNVIGYRFGTDGQGNFRVPPAGRFVISRDTAVPAFDTVGKTGGQRDSELLSHNHTVTVGDDSPDHAHPMDFMSGASDRGLGHQHTGNTAGAGQHGHGQGQNPVPFVYVAGVGSGGLYTAGSSGDGRPSNPFTWDGNHGHAFTTDVGNTPDHLHAVKGGTAGANVRHSHAVTVNANGGGATLADKNLPPYVVMNRIMKL